MICFDWHAQIFKKVLLENGRVESQGYLCPAMVGEHSPQAWKWETGVDVGMTASIGLVHMWYSNAHHGPETQPHLIGNLHGGGAKEGGRKKGSKRVAFSFFFPLVLQPVSTFISVDFGNA